MNIKEIEEKYGIVKSAEGIWQEHCMTCPGCHEEESFTIEIDMEQQGSLAGRYYTCEKCLTSFKAAYTIEVHIILESIPTKFKYE